MASAGRVEAQPARPVPVAPAAEPVPIPTAARPRRPGRPVVGWRRCANHRATPSEGVCTQCGKGFCGECVKRQGTAAICPNCDALCVSAAEQEQQEERARMRARPLTAELGTVFAYPLTDKLAYVILAVFVGVFALAASMAMFGSGFGFFVSRGLLYAYAFSAINRVSAGNLKGFMPDLSDWTDLVPPVRAGLAAMIISAGPLIALSFAYTWQQVASHVMGPRSASFLPAQPTPSPSPTLPPQLAAMLQQDSTPASEPGEGEGEPGDTAAAKAERERMEQGMAKLARPAVPAWAVIAFLLAFAWQLAYAPIALVAAAISRGFLATLNPLVGLDAIRRMGGVYWTAMAVYTGIVLVAGLLGLVLSLIPIGGRLLTAFVDSYAYLAIGCLLGFAVFKKAPELDLD